MKAVIYERYGSPDVLRLTEIAQPVPGPGQVRVQIRAAGVNAADWHLLRADPFLARLDAGLFKPKRPVLGADIAGVVDTVGEGVTRFKPGDAVYGDLAGCGFGGFAEYAAVPESVLSPMPSNLAFSEAAAIPMAAVTALQALRDKGGVGPGKHVLINGASGGVGTFALQIAKVLCAEVTAVCSTSKLEQARALGADHVVDYTREDFTRTGQTYDVIIAANGNRSLGDYKRALALGGVYVMVGGSTSQIMQAVIFGSLRSGGGKKLTNLMAKPNAADLAVITSWIEAGHVKPIMDRTYPFEQTADAIRYVEEGHARGKVVVTLGAAS